MRKNNEKDWNDGAKCAINTNEAAVATNELRPLTTYEPNAEVRPMALQPIYARIGFFQDIQNVNGGAI